MSFELNLQKAVIARLRTYTDLTSLLANPDAIYTNGVYDYVPEAADSGDASYFPYVSFHNPTNENFDTDTTDGFESTFTLHTWSRLKPMTETKKIMGQIYTALHHYDLTVDDYNVVSLHLEFSESMRGDDKTNHGMQRFRILAVED